MCRPAVLSLQAAPTTSRKLPASGFNLVRIARIFYGKLGSLSDDALEGDDHYRVVPGDATAPLILKQRPNAGKTDPTQQSVFRPCRGCMYARRRPRAALGLLSDAPPGLAARRFSSSPGEAKPHERLTKEIAIGGPHHFDPT